MRIRLMLSSVVVLLVVGCGREYGSGEETPMPAGMEQRERERRVREAPHAEESEAQAPEVVRREEPNRLAEETSPYLLQHQYNPVEWYPWGEEAFAKAESENKLIFLSVGYSSCTWCHAMNRETFMDPEVAAYLNEHVIAIKVDREERMDVDRAYTRYLLAATGGAGHPMNVWLTPDRKPLMAGTYFPRENQERLPGFLTVSRRMVEMWEANEEELRAKGSGDLSRLREEIASADAAHRGENLPEAGVVRTLLEEMVRSHVPEFGGFRRPPKFPRTSTLAFLHHLAATWEGTGEADTALELSALTLRGIIRGGIHDHLGGGFHRYVVDPAWRVPHFEKLLYDQALNTMALLEAVELTGDAEFEEAARSTLEYVKRRLARPGGGYYSGEDADSLPEPDAARKVEGAYYVWTQEEVDRVLGEREAPLFRFVYGVTPDGNVPENLNPQPYVRERNILRRQRSVAEAAEMFAMSAEEVRTHLELAKDDLLHARARRPRPHVDDKVITGWNGLMISALAQAARVLEEPRYEQAARQTADFLLSELYDPDRRVLKRLYHDGPGEIDGFAPDYAYMIQGMLDLHATTEETRYLDWALELQDRMDDLFLDEEGGGYFDTDGRDERIVLRIKDDYDSAKPATSSVAANNLLRLAELTESADYRARAERCVLAFAEVLEENPLAMPRMMIVLDRLQRP